ncbi:Serine--glyoxylate aminotransferase [Candidatus Syntrophocurvum alkaliphilum]|uniref:Tritium exchange subunit n=1 Tax=Candidatus Syntrophocurvum alkaliphilum TaxID=2293317 RepID=A0A6I6DN66_9FIRM|nr:alanine--glyoxylate aminotransferase family protein [Candidatus Syntrophocurvum alkaliphilum]QGU00601.1 Serine--glyoxylate aminotransferase [Candidatus Syntrophocurvum alkaliphilum]
MRGDQYLLLPGPTPIPERIMRAMNKSMVNHRGPELKEIIKDVTVGVKKTFKTENNVLIYPASGSGALEAAVVNFISPGDKVLSISIGVFGDRFAKIATQFGANVEKLDFKWGEVADPKVVKERIDQDVRKEIKVVLVTHNETSTGACNDIKAIKEAMGDHPAIIMVDAVSSLGATDLRMDEWNLDVVVSGSQKAYMIPPGLSFLACNSKALEVHKKNNNPKYYWDVTAGLKYLEKGQTPYTPAISLLYGLQEALKMIQEEGLENIFNRHRNYRDMVRAAVKEIGLQLLTDDKYASNALTSVVVPEEIGANKVRKFLLEEFNIALAGGQQTLDDKIFRIGHLGYVRQLDLLATLGAIEIALVKFGYDLQLGKGLNKAQQFILNNR